jgi:hypothetical protein
MYNLFMPEDNPEIQIVTVSCPKCPRQFKTLLWIAESKRPKCPKCDCAMEIVLAAAG